MMKGAIKKFFIASMLMWMTPIAILYGFKHNLFPANILIASHIYMAMQEASHKHEPDPAFLAEAKASVNQSASDSDKSSQSSKKEEKDVLCCDSNGFKEFS